MKTAAILALLMLTAPHDRQQASPAPKPIRMAATCFSAGEESSGLHKICYYNCLGDRVAITVAATQLCPISINR